jgi:hypothetical protein
MPTDEQKLAAVLRAFISRPGRWEIEAGTVHNPDRDCYRLKLHGEVIIDCEHGNAIKAAVS